MEGKVIIIAEAGVNHNGSLELAKKLIDEASRSGADFVKFQTFKAIDLVTKTASKAKYQINNDDKDESHYEMLKRLELDYSVFHELKLHCEVKGIKFMSSGFSEEDIDLLDDLGVEYLKIPSGEITNKPYLRHIASKGKLVLLSTGMTCLKEIREAMDVLIEFGLAKEQITVLHCNTAYPTPMIDVNLKAMLTIKRDLAVEVGYSDHTQGIEIPIAAVALGAKVIEKHFTLDRNLPGPDHKASLEPDELKEMVAAIRNVEQALSGSGIKEPSESERQNILVARKSIHTKCSLCSGTVINADHLVMKRPGNGISPMEIDKVIGKKLRISLEQDTLLLWDHLQK